MTTTAHTPRATLTTSEAARELEVSPQTVRRFAEAGVLRASRLTPRSPRRFHRDDVERLLNASAINRQEDLNADHT